MTVTLDEERRLGALAAAWPVGLQVRHTHTRWPGTVTAAAPGDVPGRFLPASPWVCLVGTCDAAAVNVTFERNGQRWTAWIRADYLTPSGTAAAPRQRTRVHRSQDRRGREG